MSFNYLQSTTSSSFPFPVIFCIIISLFYLLLDCAHHHHLILLPPAFLLIQSSKDHPPSNLSHYPASLFQLFICPTEAPTSHERSIRFSSTQWARM
eukprot:scaffold3320_cov136-Skeletonema_menzelii.AAC.8